MDQRLQFVTDALSDRFTMTELCERYGLSRRIGYKWLARFTEDGKRGLVDRTRRPHTCPTQNNTERPHDALGGDTPASRYTGSPRAYPERLPTPEYPRTSW
jgi:transposase-like protein